MSFIKNKKGQSGAAIGGYSAAEIIGLAILLIFLGFIIFYFYPVIGEKVLSIIRYRRLG